MVVPASSAPNTSMRRARSWLTLSSPVSMTRSARSRVVRAAPARRRSSRRRPGGLRMPATGPLEPLDQDVVGGVEEEDPDPVASGRERIHGGQHVVEVTAASPHHEGHPLHLRAGAVDQLAHLGDQGRRACCR